MCVEPPVTTDQSNCPCRRSSSCGRTFSSRFLPIPLTRSESLRARLKPRGDEPATLLIFGGLGPARAVLARRAGLTAGA